MSSVFDVLTFLVLWWALGANSPERQSLFQSGWFVEGLLSQTLIVHMIRTQRIPFVQSVAATPVLLLTGLIMAVGIWLPFSPIAGASSLVRLPGTYFLWLAAILPQLLRPHPGREDLVYPALPELAVRNLGRDGCGCCHAGATLGVGSQGPPFDAEVGEVPARRAHVSIAPWYLNECARFDRSGFPPSR